jgi:formyl-CoA transferase
VANWAARLAAAGIACGPVGDIGGALRLAEDLGLSPTGHVGAGCAPQVRHPVGYTNAMVATPAPPPRLGEHTELVRTWLAGDGALPA